MKKLSTLLVFIIAALVICACGSQNTKPTNTPIDISAVQTSVSVKVMQQAHQTQTAGAPTETPIPTNTSTPPNTATPLPTPLSLSGVGDSILDITWPQIPAIAVIENTGANAYFGITPYGENNKRMVSIVNASEPYKGTRPFNFDGKYTKRLEIKASGAWSITLLPIFQARVITVPSAIEGTGDDVIILNGAIPDMAGIVGFADKGYFGVIPYNSGANRMHSLVNEQSPYHGTVIVDANTVIIEIKSDGKWTIGITKK